MIDASAARRYARALFALGLEAGRHEEYGDEVESVLAALDQSREAGALLRNPGYTLQQRHNAVDALASALKLSPVVVNFLRLMVDRQRVSDLAQVARAYRAMVDEKVGRMRATVTSAAPLTDRETKNLREAIAGLTGRTIVLDSKTDPALIGGVVTQVGPRSFDGSLRTQLERMREQLKRAPV
ncbi:MAG: ATP synthase F1 subunit delta [Myxococcales bacterium]|nr:ATP synthase F1 subunit delta [Myxococcales bacterium]